MTINNVLLEYKIGWKNNKNLILFKGIGELWQAGDWKAK